MGAGGGSGSQWRQTLVQYKGENCLSMRTKIVLRISGLLVVIYRPKRLPTGVLQGSCRVGMLNLLGDLMRVWNRSFNSKRKNNGLFTTVF